MHVFGPDSTDIDAVVQAAFAQNGGQNPPDNGQFSSQRFAFLFKPGTYTNDIPVGYYTSVAGLGLSPGDVVFTGSKGVYCTEGAENYEVGALDTFWRSAENFRSQASFAWWNGAPPGMLWAVSQAAPLRRVWVDQNLLLFQYQTGDAAGYSSGGFMADSFIAGQVNLGSQQQWINRNVKMGSFSGGVWNVVHVGCVGGPEDSCSESLGARTSQANTPIIAEKPFISVKEDGRFQLNVPESQTNTVGPSWQGSELLRTIDFEFVYVARADVDTPQSLNAALSSSSIKGLVFTPGIYNLGSCLHVTQDHFVILGLGLATLVATAGNCLLEIDAAGVRVAALLLQAGPISSPTLLSWAGRDGRGGGFLYDIFARVGGPDDDVAADVMVQIDADNVVGDNFWLWRADHTVNGLVKSSRNPVEHGLLVNGNQVTMYGLAAEHTLKDLVVWNGHSGQTFFYQSELPYDVNQSFGDSGYVGYRVASNVSSHFALGVGVYSYFRDFSVTVSMGFSVPDALRSAVRVPLTVFLNGQGQISHVINQVGSAVNSTNHVSIVC